MYQSIICFYMNHSTFKDKGCQYSLAYEGRRKRHARQYITLVPLGHYHIILYKPYWNKESFY